MKQHEEFVPVKPHSFRRVETRAMPYLGILVICGLVAGILLTIEAGYAIGLRRWAGVPVTARAKNSTLEASIFGLTGLLIAFVFNGAGSRFENRRHLIVTEANMIGTAYLRLDLLPPEAQPQLRDDFREYVRSRLRVFQYMPGTEARTSALAESRALQENIWEMAVAAARGSSPSTQTLVLSALNEVIDITTDQSVSRSTHPPAAVFVMLAVAMLGSSALAGYSMSVSRARDWVTIAAYAFLLGIAVFVILDYEFPRVGFIRIDPMDQILQDTLAEME